MRFWPETSGEGLIGSWNEFTCQKKGFPAPVNLDPKNWPKQCIVHENWRFFFKRPIKALCFWDFDPKLREKASRALKWIYMPKKDFQCQSALDPKNWPKQWVYTSIRLFFSKWPKKLVCLGFSPKTLGEDF